MAVPSKRWNRLSKKTKELMKVQWDCSRPSNCFHWSCWNEAVASAERQGTRTEICAHSILRSVHESVERFDSIETVKKHAKVFAKYLAESSYTVCFTGAGVSAAAGIPTYRGAEGIDTMDHLGGANDEAAADMPSKKRKVEMQTNVDENDESSYTALRPTFTHRALARLHTMNKMHYCVTQNCDDLHAKGGFPRDAMSELHGNVFCEFCEDCGREYHRAFEVDAWSTGW